MQYCSIHEEVNTIHVGPLVWEFRVAGMSKLIFTHAQNDHFQHGELQSLTVANGHLNSLYLVKECANIVLFVDRLYKRQ